MSNADELIRSALDLGRDKGFANEVAQVRAKAVLAEVTGAAPPYNWTYIPPRLVRNSLSVLLDLQDIAGSEPDILGPAEPVALQIARLWEALAGLEEGADAETSLLIAAISYELAGYQANASYMAKQLERRLNGSLKGSSQPAQMTRLAVAFLRRQFLWVTVNASRYQVPPDLSESSIDRLILDMALGATARGLDLAAHYFLSGDSASLMAAVNWLERGHRAFSEEGSAADANLAGSLASLVPLMSSRSTWTHLGSLFPEEPRWQRYLRLLARGTGDELLFCSSISELWPSQLKAIEGGLLRERTSAFVRMPTSAGKTRVAELAIVDTLIRRRGAKAVYVAPYRALVTEVEQGLLPLFADLGFRVSKIVGTFESDDFENALLQDADVLVLTPEKLDLLQRLNQDLLGTIDLFVFDEGQLIDDPQRGPRFELLLARIRRALPQARFLFLSAVVPDQTLKDFAQWLQVGEEGVLQSNWRPSVQRLALFEWQGDSGRLQFSQDEDVDVLQGFVSGVIRKREYSFINQATGKRNHQVFPDPANKGQTASELAYRFSELGPVLVFCAQTNWAEGVAKALERRLELAELSGETNPAHFRTPATRAAIVSSEWLGEDHIVTRLLRRGIGLHHGRLPETVRQALEADFRDERYRVIVATNTLAQGVNLPLRTVVMHSTRRSVENAAGERAMQPIPARDYWNIAGRAGRAGHETEGTIIHLALSRTDRSDFNYYLGLRHSLEPLESALFRFLAKLTSTRLSPDLSLEDLDSEILALLVEENMEEVTEEWIERVFGQTLFEVQARQREASTEPLRKGFGVRAQQILAGTSGTSERIAFSTTGLRLRSCQALGDQVRARRAQAEQFLAASDSSELGTWLDLLIDALLQTEEMQPQWEYSGNYATLLGEWIKGGTIGDLRAQFGSDAPSPEELARFIEDSFGYRLPWGIAAFVRIAQQELALDDSALGPISRFLPSMVRSGVPTPEAAWAVEAGIPVRRTAIEMASDFIREVGHPDYDAFMKWLGSLDFDDLFQSYGLRPPIIDEVTRALTLAGRNPYLVAFEGTDRVLPIVVPVRGTSYDDRALVARRVGVGDQIELERAYDNPVDHNAIRVLHRGEDFGYLPRQLAQVLAPDVDSGARLAAEAVDVQLEGSPLVTIEIRQISSPQE